MSGSTRLAILGLALAVAASTPAGAAGKKSASDEPREVKRSLFSGNESRIVQLGWLSSACKGQTPDIHVVTQPSKGTIRFEETTGTVAAATSPLQKKCLGKPVRNTELYYRANEKSVGRDRVVLDADTKLGYVVRYVILVDIKPGAKDPEKADNSQTRPMLERISRTVLTGNEMRLAAPNYLNMDCSSGPLPDVRIVEAPKNGAYRTEETSIAAERGMDKPRAVCNGKPVNAVAVYYKPKPDFTGLDQMGIDVDYHDGTVRRYIYMITVR
jgi:hypothetical protein